MSETPQGCSGAKCESCGMTIDSGAYCPYCVDDKGELQAFDERLNRMSQWLRREAPDLSPEAAQSQALDYMATMPAWREHPELLARRGH